MAVEELTNSAAATRAPGSDLHSAVDIMPKHDGGLLAVVESDAIAVGVMMEASSARRESQLTAKRLAIGTIVGAGTLLAAGYVVFGLALGNFYAYALNAGSATGVLRQPFLFWAVAVGALSYGALLTLAIGSRPGSPTLRAGMTIGAVVGFLVWFTADFMLYGISNVLNLTSVLIDPLLELVPSAITGGVIALVLARIR